MSKYHPEPYWSEVAQRIEARQGTNVIAGDDEPYYRYKRVQFLQMLHHIDFDGKSVLEIGSGPGGNLKEIWEQQQVKTLEAVDISDEMIALARRHNHPSINISKINGTRLPFDDDSKDIVFTATVLQHNTDEQMMIALLKDMARVSAKHIYLFERIEKNIKGDELCIGRPVEYYEQILKREGFELESSQFINIRVSYFISGIIRKLFNPSSRKEGEAMTKTAIRLQQWTLVFTKRLDRIFTSKTDIARLTFVKKTTN